MTAPVFGVVIVTFNSSDVILDCLESLLAAENVRLAIVVVDNASTDGTPGLLRDWAAGRLNWQPPDDLPLPLEPCAKPVKINDQPVIAESHTLALLQTGLNGGFAFGVNSGLAALAKLACIDRFWVLNPDSIVPSMVPLALATASGSSGDFSLMGGRLLYLETPEKIQMDGGYIDWRTGVTKNVNQYAPANSAPPDASSFDFITGASMVVSRRFYETVGPMQEDYFLYYEEVDWALRRGEMPLAYCPDAVVYHRAGTSIGSASATRKASPLSLYFKHRARIMFLRRFSPLSLPLGFAFSLAKAGQLVLQRDLEGAVALMRGSLRLSSPIPIPNVLSSGIAGNDSHQER
ncbi:MAG: glycosyltransferase family 2 protein [Rhizobiaceae bacterium]